MIYSIKHIVYILNTDVRKPFVPNHGSYLYALISTIKRIAHMKTQAVSKLYITINKNKKSTCFLV